MDGISCYLMVKLIPNHKNVDVTFEDYNTVNNTIIIFVNSGEYKNYSHVYVTDLGISEEAAAKLDSIKDECMVTFIDHHDTNKWIAEKYSWATVISTVDGRKISATKLIFDKYNQYMPINCIGQISLFASLVSDYDTYTWKDENKQDPKLLQDLFSIYGRNIFLEKMEQRLATNQPIITEDDKFLSYD